MYQVRVYPTFRAVLFAGDPKPSQLADSLEQHEVSDFKGKGVQAFITYLAGVSLKNLATELS